jgi:RNA polymerase sigma-70 factor (ECF subfamily)
VPERPTDRERDDKLMRAHLRGEDGAFDAIVQKHGVWLRRAAFARLRDWEEAADAYASALESAYRYAHTFQFRASVGSWLYRILDNECRGRAGRRLDLPLLEDPPVRVPDEVARSNLRLDVYQALNEIPPEQALPIMLVDMQGWTLRDVADMLDTTPRAVGRARSKGLARLANLLEEYGSSSRTRARRDGDRADGSTGTSRGRSRDREDDPSEEAP